MKTKIVLGILFITIILTAEKHSAKDETDEYLHFNNYRQEQTLQNYYTAVNYYIELLKTDKSDYNANLMLSYLHLMELNKNLDILEENLDSLSVRTKFSFANLLLDIGKNEQCISIYNQINEITPKWSCPWRHKGEALMNIQDYENAEKATLKAIETRKDHFDAYTQLANIQIKLGKNKLALETFNKGMEFYKSDAEEDVSDLDIKFLKMKLWKLNNKTNEKEYKLLIEELKNTAPNDERW